MRQVAVPAALLRQVGLGPGSEVYFRLSSSEPGTITLLPADMVDVRVRAGSPADQPGRDVRRVP